MIPIAEIASCVRAIAHRIYRSAICQEEPTRIASYQAPFTIILYPPFSELSRWQQATIILHELTHFFQFLVYARGNYDTWCARCESSGESMEAQAYAAEGIWCALVGRRAYVA